MRSELARKINFLFIIGVVSLALTTLGSFIDEGGLSVIISIGEIVCDILFLIAIFDLKEYDENYKKSGIFIIVGMVFSLISFLLSVGAIMGGSFGGIMGMMSLIVVGSLAFGLLQIYYEYKAHANVIRPYDLELSDKWQKLWSITFWLTLIVILSMVLALTGSVIILLLLMIVATIALAITNILRLVYLYKMKNIIETLADVDIYAVQDDPDFIDVEIENGTSDESDSINE